MEDILVEMQDIVMCAYYGMCDSQGHIIGHLGKVTKEYVELLNEEYKVHLMASPCIYKEFIGNDNINLEKLMYDIVVDEPFTIKKRIFDKIKILKNIDKCVRRSPGEILFFYQVDFFFFMYLYLFYRKKDKRIYALIYHQNFTGGKFESILNYIYKRALTKLEGVIYTQKKKKILHDKSLYMPDYLYDAIFYEKYNVALKEEKIVCLGTMNRYKQLEELVEVFKNTDIPLEICGRFDDKGRVQQLVKRKSNNIVICDCILTTEEYYQKLGRAKYSILPYDMKQYVSRTSGVLLESIYVGSIPIAPRLLLEQNEITGYAYNDLDELRNFQWDWNIQETNMRKLLQENDRNVVGRKLRDFFKQDDPVKLT